MIGHNQGPAERRRRSDGCHVIFVLTKSEYKTVEYVDIIKGAYSYVQTRNCPSWSEDDKILHGDISWALHYR